MKTILITGGDGQLGSEFVKISKIKNDFKFIFTDIQTLDICNKSDVEIFFDENKIDFVINCAAYTAVDKAETDTKIAEKINILGVKTLSDVSENHDSVFFHISTDYVFDGFLQGKPYVETDVANPNSAYGRTKLEGEKSINPKSKHFIIRTSWLYSFFGNNFVKTMIKYGTERKEMNVVFDQIGTPTYAGDLADAIIKMIEFQSNENFDINKYGIYHFSNEGVASWYDFAIEIMRMAKIECKINPIETKDYPTPANRPHFSVFSKNKIKSNFGIEIPYWKDSLVKCIKYLDNNS